MMYNSVTLNELDEAIEKAKRDVVKKVLIGIMNDFVDLLYNKTTDYTTGKRVLPKDTTLSDVVAASVDPDTDQKFIDIFRHISEIHKSGDLTPPSEIGDNGYPWDPKLRPIVVLVRLN